jgi:hypothetical protein
LILQEEQLEAAVAATQGGEEEQEVEEQYNAWAQEDQSAVQTGQTHQQDGWQTRTPMPEDNP